MVGWWHPAPGWAGCFALCVGVGCYQSAKVGSVAGEVWRAVGEGSGLRVDLAGVDLWEAGGDGWVLWAA
ncbi:MAG: hypothetical protein RI897_4062 [Verrucomicrobiota bacterium]